MDCPICGRKDIGRISVFKFWYCSDCVIEVHEENERISIWDIDIRGRVKRRDNWTLNSI